MTFSGVLNALDGIMSQDGRIIFMTSNHPEKLDPALLREGRFDLKLTIGLMDDSMFVEYINRFYPEFKIPAGYKLKEQIAPCVVQKLVFENRNSPEAVLKELGL